MRATSALEPICRRKYWGHMELGAKPISDFLFFPTFGPQFLDRWICTHIWVYCGKYFWLWEMSHGPPKSPQVLSNPRLMVIFEMVNRW